MPSVTGGNSVTSSTQINTGVVTTDDLLDGDVAKADVGTGAVGTDEILDDEIVNADISPTAGIVLTKIANGTQGGILYRGAGGVLMELPQSTLDYYLATQGAGADPVWKALSAPVLVTDATSFETAARFTPTITGGGGQTSNTYNSAGLVMHHGYTYSASSDSVLWQLLGKASTLYLGNPTFSCRLNIDYASISAVQIYVGLGNPTVATAGHTFTVGHCGFKIIKSGGVISLYATQADGTTETASSALTTVAVGDDLDLIARVTSGTNVSYYWRKNGGALSSATTLTTNLPAGVSQTAQFSFSTVNVDDQSFQVTMKGAKYER